MMLTYEAIPFIRFRDELIFNYETKFKTKFEEAVLNYSQNVNVYYRCSFEGCQFGDNTRMQTMEPATSLRPNEREETMSKFIFKSENKFDNCQFGDHTTYNNYVRAIESSPSIDAELKNILIEIRQNIDQAQELNETTKCEVVDALNMLSNEFTKEAKDRDVGRLQNWWNQVKEGVQTSYHLTSIVVGLGKLQGWI
jgi:hypothetical protein